MRIVTDKKLNAKIKRIKKEKDYRINAINENIGYAISMANSKFPEVITTGQADSWNTAYITAMNFILYHCGLRVLSKTEIKEATEMYG